MVKDKLVTAPAFGEPAAPSEHFRRRVTWAFSVIRRGKFVLASCVLLGLLPTIAYLYNAERLYIAQAEILVESPESSENLLERSYGRSRLTETSIQTEADILSSASLAAKVIAKLQLAQDPEFNAALREPSLIGKVMAAVNPLPFLTGQTRTEHELSGSGREELAKTRIQKSFLSRLSVRALRRSFVISVEFTSNNPEKAAKIANTLADLYVVERLEASYADSRRANEWLAERLESLRRDVNVAEQAAERYRITNSLGDRGKGARESTVTGQQLTELNSRLVLARADLAQRQARYQQALTLARSQGSVDTASDVLQSALIQRMREQETIKQRELSEATKTYGERHPRIIGYRADLDELRQKIAEEIRKIASALANEVATAQAGVTTLEREIGGLKVSVDESRHAEVQLRELDRQAEANRSLYETFLARFKRDMGQERIQRANARVLSSASIPAQPALPRRLRIFVLSIFLSFSGGLFVTFLLDRLNGRVRSVEEAEELTGLPVLSVIPVLKSPDETLDARSAMADSFRALRVVLAAQPGGQEAKIVLITSSVPREGKSFIARHFAFVCAATGQRVLVVDADLMRPQQHLAFSEQPAEGLTQILADATIDPLSKVVPDPRGGFDILPAGKVDALSGHKLASGRIEEIFAVLRPHYDRIIVDAPPSLAATDAQNLGLVADQVVYSIKWNDTKRDAVTTGISCLSRVGANVAGVVLSQAKENWESATAYGGYGYFGSYGKYYRQ